MNRPPLATVRLLVSVNLFGCSPSERNRLSSESTVTPVADWILTGGSIYTVDTANPWADAVAIKDGRFIFVGEASDAEQYAAI